MKLLVIGKFPPIQGGVSAHTFQFVRDAAAAGHDVTVITNAAEVEPGYRQQYVRDDELIFRELTRGIAVVNVTPLGGFGQVPRSDCFVSRLAGAARRVLQRDRFDLVLGWYFEPYGVAAAIARSEFRTPTYLVHAGSDLGRLSHHPDLREMYALAIDQVDGVIARRSSVDVLRNTYPEAATKIRLQRRRRLYLPELVLDGSKLFPLEEYAVRSPEVFRAMALPQQSIEAAEQMARQDVAEGPRIVAYGKVARSKGSYALVDALRLLAERDVPFHFLSIIGGSRRSIKDYLEQLACSPPLMRRTTLLPFVPHWRIRAMLESVDIACFLENDFPIAIHRPSVPLEVIAAGRCLVTTREIVTHLPFAAHMVNRQNYVCAADPNRSELLADQLRELLCDTVLRSHIASHARVLATRISDLRRAEHPLVRFAESLVASAA